MKSYRVKLSTVDLHYLREGKGDYLIIIPSLMLTSQSYAILGSILAKYFTVIIPDIYKGMTKTKSLPNTYEDYTKILREFIVKLGINKFNLIGVSFSGPIVGEYVASYPSEINKIIFMNTYPIYFDVDHILRRLIAGYIKLFPRLFATSKSTKTSMELLRDAAGYLFHNPAQFIREISIVVNRRIHQAIETINKPGLLILSSSDEFIPFELREKLPKNKSMKIDVIDDSHGWFFFNPDLACRKVRDFFSQV